MKLLEIILSAFEDRKELFNIVYGTNLGIGLTGMIVVDTNVLNEWIELVIRILSVISISLTIFLAIRKIKKG